MTVDMVSVFPIFFSEKDHRHGVLFFLQGPRTIGMVFTYFWSNFSFGLIFLCLGAKEDNRYGVCDRWPCLPGSGFRV